jgi:hypothetical protein
MAIEGSGLVISGVQLAKKATLTKHTSANANFFIFLMILVSN